MAFSVFDNAIGWAQFKLLGGWKNILATAGAYVAIAGAVIFVMIRGIELPAADILSNFVTFFMAIQVVVVLLFGTQRIGSAVRADVTAKLIESHRLMPTSHVSAVLGYLFGSTMQALSFYVVTVVIGAACALGAGMRLQPWLFSNFILLLFALMVWTVVMFFSFRSGGSSIGIVLTMVFMVVSRGAPLFLLPALNVLVSPMIGMTIFNMHTGITFEAPFVFAIAAQVLLGGIYIVAAGRRYGRDDVMGFDSLLGLGFLFIWTVICVVALRRPELFHWRMGGYYFREYREAGFIASVSSVLLAAILPVSSAVRAAAMPAHRRSASQGWHAPPMLAVLLALLIASGVNWCLPPWQRNTNSALRTLAVIAAFLISTRYVLGMAHRLNWGPRKVMVAWLVLSWALPIIAETVRSAAVANNEVNRMSAIAMVSPPGEIYQTWSRNPLVHTDSYTGLAVQCGIAATTALVFHATRLRRETQTAGNIAIAG